MCNNILFSFEKYTDIILSESRIFVKSLKCKIVRFREYQYFLGHNYDPLVANISLCSDSKFIIEQPQSNGSPNLTVK